MFNLDDIRNENNDNHNLKRPYIWDQDSGSLIDKIYLNAKDLDERKYQFIIKKREEVGIKHLNDPKAFIEYSTSKMIFTKTLVIIIHQEKEEL